MHLAQFVQHGHGFEAIDDRGGRGPINGLAALLDGGKTAVGQLVIVPDRRPVRPGDGLEHSCLEIGRLVLDRNRAQIAWGVPKSTGLRTLLSFLPAIRIGEVVSAGNLAQFPGRPDLHGYFHNGFAHRPGVDTVPAVVHAVVGPVQGIGELGDLAMDGIGFGPRGRRRVVAVGGVLGHHPSLRIIFVVRPVTFRVVNPLKLVRIATVGWGGGIVCVSRGSAGCAISLHLLFENCVIEGRDRLISFPALREHLRAVADLPVVVGDVEENGIGNFRRRYHRLSVRLQQVPAGILRGISELELALGFTPPLDDP